MASRCQLPGARVPVISQARLTRVRTGSIGSTCCATLIMRMSATLILGMSWLWKTPPGGVRRGWVVLGLSRVVLRVSR